MQILPGWCPGSQRLICPRPQQPVRQQWADMCLRSDIIIIQLKVTVLELETKVHPKIVITEKAPTRAFSLLKAINTAFTFKTLLRHKTLC